MGASHGDFVKYPRTPHLFGSKGTDDDKHLGEQESNDFIADPSLIVEEKIDGTNVGIHFTQDGRMKLQCRGHEITDRMHPQYDLFKQWTSAKLLTLMSGLPGAGKDTWLSRHREHLPVVSLDEIRAELDVTATGDQGTVVQTAREQCREHLRAGRNFAFNATNISSQLRKRWIELASDYNTRIEIVYVEPPVETILAQNRRRTNPIPDKVILGLLDRLEPPTVAACHALMLVAP